MKERIRPIFYHKQATSARLLFLRFSDQGICGLGGLPRLAEVMDGERAAAEERVLSHPSHLGRTLAAACDIPESAVEVDPGFREWIDVPDGPLSIYLLRFTAIDPPGELARGLQARFISLTETQGLGQVEMELLRRAYCHVLG